MVLGRRADHGRAADVDVFDTGVVVGIRSDGGFERVKVYNQQIDRADAMFSHGRDVFVIVTQGKQPAMHHRMQRFDPAIHHFGEPCDLRHVAHVQPRVAQCLGGSACAQQFNPPVAKCATQVDQAGFI